jgi:hypothetical protein
MCMYACNAFIMRGSVIQTSFPLAWLRVCCMSPPPSIRGARGVQDRPPINVGFQRRTVWPLLPPVIACRLLAAGAGESSGAHAGPRARWGFRWARRGAGPRPASGQEERRSALPSPPPQTRLGAPSCSAPGQPYACRGCSAHCTLAPPCGYRRPGMPSGAQRTSLHSAPRARLPNRARLPRPSLRCVRPPRPSACARGGRCGSTC